MALLKLLPAVAGLLAIVATVSGDPDPSYRGIVLRKYDKGGAPGNGDRTMILEVPKLTVTSLDVDEMTQTLEVKGWLQLKWKDSRLSWGPEAQDNKDGYLHFKPNEVWIPDLALYNAEKSSETLKYYGDSDVLVGYNGTVLWVPPVTLRARCELSLRKWPYDTQVCTLILGSWTYEENSLNITQAEDDMTTVDVKEFSILPNTEWTIDNVAVRREAKAYECCPGSLWPTINIEFTISRHSSTYCYSVLLPIMMVTALNLLIFALPKHRGERVNLGLVNFLVVVLFLKYFYSALPVLDDTPLMVTLYGANLFFIVVILTVAVLTISFTEGCHVTGTPKWTHWIFNRTVASVLCLKNLQKITNARREGRSYSFKAGSAGTAGNGSVAVEEPLNPENKAKDVVASNKAEWYFLASVLDRIVLVIYLTVTVFLVLYVHI